MFLTIRERRDLEMAAEAEQQRLERKWERDKVLQIRGQKKLNGSVFPSIRRTACDVTPLIMTMYSTFPFFFFFFFFFLVGWLVGWLAVLWRRPHIKRKLTHFWSGVGVVSFRRGPFPVS